MLEVKDATIAIGGKTLARRLSFTARDGQLTCITGAEGSGKTTLIRTLMGFVPVEEGFVSMDGELLTVHSAHAFRCFMVYLPQNIGQLAHQLRVPEAPIGETEEYAVWNMVLPSVEPERESELLSPEDVFRLEEQTILAAGDRQIIIADEPAACLSPELTERLLSLLQLQASKGKTVLIASRRPSLVARAAQVVNLDLL